MILCLLYISTPFKIISRRRKKGKQKKNTSGARVLLMMRATKKVSHTFIGSLSSDDTRSELRDQGLKKLQDVN